MEPSPPDDPGARFMELQEVVAALLQEQRDLHRQLAEVPDPGGPAERQLFDCIARRDRVLPELGRALALLLVHGDRFEFDEPGDDAVNEAEVEEKTPMPRGPPADLSTLRALAEQGLAPSWTETEPPPPRERILDVARALGEPGPVTDREAARELLDRLIRAHAGIDEWLDHAEGDQRAVFGLVSSLARHLQSGSGIELHPSQRHALDWTLSSLAAWSREHLPDRGRGEHASHLDEARYWWGRLFGFVPPRPPGPDPQEALARLETALADQVESDEIVGNLVEEALRAGLSQSDARLVGLLAPHAERLHALPGLKTLKSQVRDSNRDDPQDDDDTPSSVPDDWVYWPFTVDRDAVILGGNPKRRAEERIQRAFRFASVQWMDLDVRRLAGLVERVRGGNLGMVIILRSFMPHGPTNALRPACKEGGVPFVMVDKGFGTHQVQRAIERYCSGLVDEEGPAPTSEG